MNFDFSDEQKELQGQARRYLKDRCDPTVPRRVLEGDEPYAQDLWQGLAEQGFTGAAIPEEYGGVGFGYLELCVIAEELGRAVAPVPFSSSIYLAAEALIVAGSEAQKTARLPKLASGESIGTLALAEGPRALAADNLETEFSDGKITGAKWPVPDGDVADFAIVVARNTPRPSGTPLKGGPGDSGARREVGLYLVDLNGDGVTREGVDTIDPTRSHARIDFKGAAAEPLGAGANWDTLQHVFDRAAVLIAFEQLGGADRCLNMARAYATERYAFGRPRGSFQALKHRMADMYVKNELARSNCYYGAWALSTDAEELPLAAATARVAATEAYNFAAKENIQLHGGMGFTWEADCHFYYRRAKLLSLALGSPRVWKDKLTTELISQREASLTM